MTPRPNITKIEIEIIHVFKKITDLEGFISKKSPNWEKNGKKQIPSLRVSPESRDVHLFQRTF